MHSEATGCLWGLCFFPSVRWNHEGPELGRDVTWLRCSQAPSCCMWEQEDVGRARKDAAKMQLSSEEGGLD